MGNPAFPVHPIWNDYTVDRWLAGIECSRDPIWIDPIGMDSGVPKVVSGNGSKGNSA
jgi:hypothetical protein